jgi:undecaprenyl-diphosphatase
VHGPRGALSEAARTEAFRDTFECDHARCAACILRATRTIMATVNNTGGERRRTPRGLLSVFRDALYSSLRFIGRHVRGFYGALAAFLTIGAVVGLAASSAFILFAAVVSGGTTQRFDERVLAWLSRYRSPTLDEAALEVTSLGNGIVLFALVLVASVFLWETKHRWSVYLLIIASLGGKVLNGVLKNLFDRPRPSIVDHIDVVHSLSFPSGHAMASLITYGSVAYLVARLETTARLRTTTWTVAVILIMGIGLSRMYLGVHYPSDVIAGFVAGLAWLAFVASAFTAVRFFAYRRPEVEEEEKDLHAEEERLAGVRE